ncbi:MAG: type II toxin-antitoxin system RelE/ParE family toxin [Spirochaetes bacterium]|nr:type II toxin-antitoxin system RelE/ParE family toxin [Spirochaetota bacterium]
MGQVRWTEKSVSDLYAIHEFISKNSAVYASRIVHSIIKSTDVLHTQPFLGRVVPEFDDDSIREIINKDYRIVYRVVNERDVEILIVFHGRRELPDIDR